MDNGYSRKDMRTERSDELGWLPYRKYDRSLPPWRPIQVQHVSWGTILFVIALVAVVVWVIK